MKRIPPLRNDDAKKRAAEIAPRLDGRAQSAGERAILAEYARLGRDPVYAGEWLVSPGLAEKLAVPR